MSGTQYTARAEKERETFEKRRIKSYQEERRRVDRKGNNIKKYEMVLIRVYKDRYCENSEFIVVFKFSGSTKSGKKKKNKN